MAKQDHADPPVARAAQAVVETAADVALPTHGAVMHGTANPSPSGNAALDAALRDPVAQKGVALAMSGAASSGFIGGAAAGVVVGGGIIGLVWALWPKKKGGK